MKPLLVTSGEPAGIGPELCLELASSAFPLVVLGDRELIAERANMLGKSIELVDYQSGWDGMIKPGRLVIFHIPCIKQSVAGKLDVDNAPYVLNLLETAVKLCLENEFSGLITAPVHKAVINQAGIDFTGHTEFFAQKCGVDSVVMMLTCPKMKVALATTHLPLKDVPSAITKPLLDRVITCLHASLIQDFGVERPKIALAGLNPHAGEGGYLGREEIETIIPAVNDLRAKGMNLAGPLPADTLFTAQNLEQYSAFVAMYHDQGLPVLKYAGFGQAVNITLGLPIIRTSVDHGTALEIAGKGIADPGSLIAAVNIAMHMVCNRGKCNDTN